VQLYSPFTFQKSGKQAINRIVLAPMTNLQSHEDGTLSDDEYRWLIRRAKEGFGIIITCAAHVSFDGQGWVGELGIFDDKHIEGLTRLANGIHEHNSLGIVQIFHGGARSPESTTGLQPWSASAHTMNISKTPVEVREGTLQEIENTIHAFVAAAERAYQSGFDGVELHGAHGYLLHQFISTDTNKRTDEWGGTFENRIKLLRTILQKIKNKLPSTFIVGVRLSPEDKYTFKGIDFDESLQLAKILADDGADYIHISPWDALKKPEKYLHDEKTMITYFREALPLDIPIMVAGEIWTGTDAEKAIQLGADFVALGKAAIGIPDFPTKAKDANFIPQKPPYTVQHLKEADLSDTFISYMKRWQGFVEEKA
jgi:2,4-dienoyl-CoA reductase-like NADH-dependent reductase (Old Yellow Enzyme family)